MFSKICSKFKKNLNSKELMGVWKLTKPPIFLNLRYAISSQRTLLGFITTNEYKWGQNQWKILHLTVVDIGVVHMHLCTTSAVALASPVLSLLQRSVMFLAVNVQIFDNWALYTRQYQIHRPVEYFYISFAPFCKLFQNLFENIYHYYIINFQES